LITIFLADNAKTIFGKQYKARKDNNTHTTVNKPRWFNENCYNAKREFIENRNNFVKNKNSENRNLFSKSRTKYNRIRKQAKFNYRVKEGKKLESIANTQPRKFWKSLKHCYKNPKIKNDNIGIEELYNHFNNLLSDTPDIDITENQHPQYIQDDDLDDVITEQEVHRAVYKQNNGKACGPDEITAEIIKAAYHIISPFLVSLFNKLFDRSEYPENWGLGLIIPIFKGGDPHDAKNYRGITLNNILAKIYSQILLNRITKWTIKHEKNIRVPIRLSKGQKYN
jgi:hypothetical protein